MLEIIYRLSFRLNMKRIAESQSRNGRPLVSAGKDNFELQLEGTKTRSLSANHR